MLVACPLDRQPNPPLLGVCQVSIWSILLKVGPRSGVSVSSGHHIRWVQTDPGLRCAKWTTVASACSIEPTLQSSTYDTTATSALLSATGCLRKAGSRRTERTSLRVFVGAPHHRGRSSNRGRIRETSGALPYTVTNKNKRLL